jgi:hypothetical protein
MNSSRDDTKERQVPPRTINQHVLPRKSIERFYGPRNKVEVDFFVGEKNFPVSSKDKNFVASRAWTQFSEDGTKIYEDAFQNAVEEVLRGGSLTENHMRVFSRFYALIKARSEARYRKIARGMSMTEISSPPECTEDQILRDERRGLFYISNEEEVERVVKDLAIIQSVLATETKLDQWGLLISTGPEFLVGDDFSQCARIPVTPHVYLGWDTASRYLTASQVHQMNRDIKKLSKNFCFARSLDACWKSETRHAVCTVADEGRVTSATPNV